MKGVFMKKIKILLTSVVSILVFSVGIDVYAISASVSVSSGSVTVGNSFTASVNLVAASWDVQISASGPVTGCSLHDANVTNSGRDESISLPPVPVTCTATGEGTITINLSGKIAGENDDISTVISDSKTVTVTANNNNNNGGGGNTNPTPSEVVPRPSGNNNNTNTNTNTNNKDEKKEEKKEEKKSSNNKIKELSIDDYELKKISDTKYELTVDNDVDMITIKAEAEDSKAKVKGIGMHELVVGENKIEITVTAEDGTKNVITIMVTREESDEEEEEEKVIAPTIGNDVTPPTSKFNIIPIIMIGLDVILGIAVISVFIKNKKLKESINQMA